MAYITQADLQARLGLQAIIALFDDDGSASVNSDAMNSVLAAASARVDSYIARDYKGTLPVTTNPLPAMLVEAAIEWAVYLSYRRKPEYVKAYYGDDGLLELMNSAQDFCEKLAEGRMFIPDATTLIQENVGAVVVDNSNRLIIDSSDGTPNSGDF